MKKKLDGRHIQGDRVKLICAQLLQTNHSDRFISKMFNVAPNTVGAIGRNVKTPYLYPCKSITFLITSF